MDAKKEVYDLLGSIFGMTCSIPGGMWDDIDSLDIPNRCHKARELGQEPAWEVLIEEVREVCDKWGF